MALGYEKNMTQEDSEIWFKVCIAIPLTLALVTGIGTFICVNVLSFLQIWEWSKLWQNIGWVVGSVIFNCLPAFIVVKYLVLRG